jgi:hypothetical protein
MVNHFSESEQRALNVLGDALQAKYEDPTVLLWAIDMVQRHFEAECCEGLGILHLSWLRRDIIYGYLSFRADLIRVVIDASIHESMEA